jgi:hypothetical protein
VRTRHAAQTLVALIRVKQWSARSLNTVPLACLLSCAFFPPIPSARFPFSFLPPHICRNAHSRIRSRTALANLMRQTLTTYTIASSCASLNSRAAHPSSPYSPILHPQSQILCSPHRQQELRRCLHPSARCPSTTWRTAGRRGGQICTLSAHQLHRYVLVPTTNSATSSFIWHNSTGACQ